jgi:ribonuclease-3
MAPRRPDPGALIGRLGLGALDRALLDEALTHSSAGSSVRSDNQRLEFLGDRVLGLVMSEALYARHPDEAEGKLAPRFNDLVRKETCAEVAEEIGLGEHLRLGRSETLSGGRRKTALLGDAMEAVIAAIYLDQGLEAARDAILGLWGARLTKQREAPRDAKTAIQEWAQARGLAPPKYSEIARAGPDHAPVFTIEARLGSGQRAIGEAPSKRAAEQAAAATLLDQVEAADD